MRITYSTIGHRNRADTVGRRRAIFASRRRKRRRLHFGRIRKRKHRSRRRVTSWWKPARQSGATYIINMYANRRNRNAGRNANSGNARRGAIKKPCKCVKFYDQRFSFRKIDFIYSPSPAFQRSRTRALSRVRSTAKPLALDNESAGVIKAGRRRGYKINREGSVQKTDRGSPPDRR